jgi:hypothetical protein
MLLNVGQAVPDVCGLIRVRQSLTYRPIATKCDPESEEYHTQAALQGTERRAAFTAEKPAGRME